jgi:ABC-type multidrug transport system fused ATPase/permease subunit
MLFGMEETSRAFLGGTRSNRQQQRRGEWSRANSVRQTVEDIDLPGNIYRYVWKVSRRHQLPLIALTVCVSLLEVVPLELQRRIVDDAVKDRNYALVATLCALYLGAVLLQGGTKLLVNVYRNWVGESAVRELRRRVHALVSATSAASSTLEAEGIQASMMVGEVEPVGSFVGGSVAEPVLQIGILASVVGYMIHIDWRMAAVAILFFLPQIVFVPTMQHAMNRRTRVRVRLVRLLSVGVLRGGGAPARDVADYERIDRIFGLNMGIFKLKFSMNFLMNLSTQLQIIGALSVGAWAVLHDQLEIGGVVAFISGIGRITDPWGDLVNYFRDANLNQVKFGLLRDAINQQMSEPAVI